jgi:hypothetical protein
VIGCLCAANAPRARAEESIKAERRDDIFSIDALNRLSSGIDLQVGVGNGSFSDTSSAAFYKLDSSAKGMAPPKVNLFSGGLSYQLSGLIRFSPAFGMGLAATWYGLSPDPKASLTSTDAHQYDLVERLYFTNPGDLVAVWLDFAEGLGKAALASKDTSLPTPTTSTTTISAATLGGRLGLSFRLFSQVPGLRVGAFGGASGWIPTGMCTSSSGGGAESCDTKGLKPVPDVGLIGGVNLTFTLPLTTTPPPPTTEYVLVQSKLNVDTVEGVAAEVTDTAEYRSQLPSVRQVALSAPSHCLSETAARQTGAGVAGQTVLKTDCGVEMGEIERALTSKGGFVVQSWRALATLMAHDPTMTPTQAAAKMGAQVLFQVNSLEHVEAEPFRGANWERRFFASDIGGNLGAPASLLERDRNALRTLISQPEGLALRGSRQGSMLDINAILVSTGQTIWFYRWQKLDTQSLTNAVSVLAQRTGDGPWSPVAPPGNPGAPNVEQRSAVEYQNQTSGGGPANAREALYFKMMRDVVGDFVVRFTHPNAPALGAR